MIAPKVLQFSKDYPEVDFYKINVDEVASVASELGVRAMPTFFFFRNGEKVGEVVGANPSALKVCIYCFNIYREKTRVYRKISQATNACYSSTYPGVLVAWLEIVFVGFF